ncbi:TPA: glycosyltransferase family 4 protein [Escherichia coli]|uniref:glycosyltransferase family 4 protein n=1 Tax=Escherichia coli TaxID=562 RepID=UPI000578F893|nr:glycosyltransferase family 4 protein [Escherichia coli]EFB3655841.1 glycosyltransferase family 4 protein [Escherichia coli]EFD7794882.1 glycosyltransferase family 4 protein [Escherichia coli]EGE2589914.1 hypothetical protein [Escherichia coli]EGM8430295.1 glycosyltransferase family 4 protein [Escherichia coli]EKA2397126.1 glycosyltransferase family 4 protein [Escherichia coli]
MNKNKVVIVIDFHSKHIPGGVATFCRNLMSIRGKYEVIHYCFFNNLLFRKENKLWKIINFLTSYRIPAIYFYFLIRKEKPDYCVVNYPCLARYLGGKTTLKTKLILIQHQSAKILKRNRANFGGYNDIKHELDKYAAFTVFSDDDKSDYCNNLNLDNNDSRFFIIPHMSSIPRGIGRANVTNKLLMLARLDNNQKRFDIAIKAMDLLPEYTLDIYGSGPDEELIKKLISNSKNCNITLHQYTNELVKVIDQYDCHIMVSDFEGFGLTNIEAISRGIPIVVRNTFPAAAYISKNVGVLLPEFATEVDLANGIRKLFSNYYMYKENCILRANEFSSYNFVSKWESMLHEI